MSNELEIKEKELEESLARQLELFKAESGEWFKIGGVVLVGGLIAFTVYKIKSKKKDNTTDRALAVLEREGLLNEEIQKKLTQKSKSDFWPSLSQRLLVLGLAFAKEKFLPNLFNARPEDAKVEE